MTDGQDFGWQPQRGNSEQNWQDQPWQGNRYDTGTHRQRISALQPPRPPEGTNWFQPGSGQQYPPPDPPSQPPYGPPGGPQDRKPWAARHKVLTGLLAFCGLAFIVGAASAAGFSSSSSRSAAAAGSPAVKAPATTASPTLTKAPVATHAVTTAPSTPARQRPHHRLPSPGQRLRFTNQHRPCLPGQQPRHHPRPLPLNRQLTAPPSPARESAMSPVSFAARAITACPGWQVTARRLNA